MQLVEREELKRNKHSQYWNCWGNLSFQLLKSMADLMESRSIFFPFYFWFSKFWFELILQTRWSSIFDVLAWLTINKNFRFHGPKYSHPSFMQKMKEKERKEELVHTPWNKRMAKDDSADSKHLINLLLTWAFSMWMRSDSVRAKDKIFCILCIFVPKLYIIDNCFSKRIDKWSFSNRVEQQVLQKII